MDVDKKGQEEGQDNNADDNRPELAKDTEDGKTDSINLIDLKKRELEKPLEANKNS